LAPDKCSSRNEYERTLCGVVPNGLQGDRIGVEDTESSGGEGGRLTWLRPLERMDETNLVKRVRKEGVPEHYREEGQRDHGMR